MKFHHYQAAAGLFLFLLQLSSFASAGLFILHGRLDNSRIEVLRIQGVAALDTDGSGSNFFDCYKEAADSDAVNLEWLKNGEVTPSSPQISQYDGVDRSVLRLNLGNSEEAVTYTCRDTISNEAIPIQATSGGVAVCIADPNMPGCSTSQELQVLPGESASFRVFIGYNPLVTNPATIMWNPFNMNRSSLQDNDTRLVIPSVSLEDSGLYQVTVIQTIRDVLETATDTINLDVHVGATITSNPNSTSALEHASVTLTCVSTGNPQPTLTWEREGPKSIQVMTRLSIISTSVKSKNITLFTVTSTFTIPSVLFKDQGRYRCVATNTLTGQVQRSSPSEFAELIVMPRLRLFQGINNMVDVDSLLAVSEGSPLEIQCLGSGNLIWERSSGVAINQTNEILNSPPFNVYQTPDQINSRQRLVIQAFTPADIAVYTCRTDLVVSGNSFAESVFITSSDPAIFIEEQTIFVSEDDTAEISATVYSQTLSALTLEWYHEGRLIDVGNEERYTTSEQGNVHTLSVVRVEPGLLGMYQGVVIVGERNKSDSVQLLFPDSPSVAATPAFRSVVEGGNVSFRCLANGTEVSVVWTRLDRQPLPDGAVQTGNDLIIARTSRDHAGQYTCTVTNNVETISSNVSLMVYYLPKATIIDVQTSAASIDAVLQVSAEEGDNAPSFLCSADGVPLPVLSWRAQDGDESLPSEVFQNGNGPNVTLSWSRTLQYTDSGNYTCIATNSAGETSVRLELLVRRSPTITSLFAASSLVFSLSSPAALSLMVPSGFMGTVVTCAAMGWPAPMVQWVSGIGSMLDGGMVSETQRDANSGFASARLRWLEGFQESDAGNYRCIVQAGDADVDSLEIVSLELLASTLPIPAPVPCAVSSQEARFQVQVLDTECETWGAELKQDIAGSFMSEVVGIVRAECPDCEITFQDIEEVGIPTCSQQVERAAIFRGTVVTESASRTQNIICSLSRWQQSGALININGNFSIINSTLPLVVMDTTATTSNINSPAVIPVGNSMLAVVVGSTIGGLVVMLLLAIMLVCCILCAMRRRKRHQSHSIYDRTCQITPESKVPVGKGTEETAIYSTLNKKEMTLPPNIQPFTNDEIELTRINSLSLLLDERDNGTTNGKAFQITDFNRGAAPQDYQVAVCSRENLCDIGTTAEGGIRRNQSSVISMSTRQESVSSQLTDISFINEESSISVSDLRNSISPYEVVNSSSPRYTKKGSTLPTRMSSGSLKTRSSLPEFRQRISVSEETDDYARLDREGRTPPTLPNRQGSRVMSNSSLATPDSPLSLFMNKHRHSITNHGRGSHSDTESPPLPPRNYSPNEKSSPYLDDPPPSYDDAIMSPVQHSNSPISPISETSMISNGAYESVVMPTGRGAKDGTKNQKQLPEQQCNTSSTGLRQTSGRSILPYSQVSNSEIDSREMRISAEVPRFLVADGVGALPYEAVDRSQH